MTPQPAHHRGRRCRPFPRQVWPAEARGLLIEKLAVPGLDPRTAVIHNRGMVGGTPEL